MMQRSPAIKFYFRRLNSELVPREVDRAVVIVKVIGVDGLRAVGQSPFFYSTWSSFQIFIGHSETKREFRFSNRNLIVSRG
jgi:hypothetical protein